MRYAVLDLGATKRESRVSGYRGRLLYSAQSRSLAERVARKRVADGGVFVVVVDVATGAQLFPPTARNDNREPPVTRSGTLAAVRPPAASSAARLKCGS